MRTITFHLAAALAVFGLVTLAAPQLSAQQVNPTESSVNEEALLQALQSGGAVSGRVSIPDQQASGLIKPDNKGWADLHGGTVKAISIWSFVGMIVLLAAFYLIRGRIRIDKGFSGRTILRFGAIERFAHWLLAVSFIILALTGLNLVIGRQVILPIFGEGAFGTLSAWGKVAHNYLAWPFMVALLIVFLVWVVHNSPSKLDAQWLAQGGGLFKKGVHPPAKKFNAGQKLIFWSVVVGGAALSYTGVMLLFPELAGSPADWQFYQVIHGIGAAVLTAIILAHIYIGSIGMEGAFDAMGKGEVDLNWAKEHHSLWVEEVQAERSEKIQPKGAATPAE
jgi:formate dehydrogenase subunit gamma